MSSMRATHGGQSQLLTFLKNRPLALTKTRLEGPDLVPKTNLRRQSRKPGIGSKRFHPGLRHQPGETDAPLSQAALHPSVCLIHLTQHGMERRYLIRTNISALAD